MLLMFTLPAIHYFTVVVIPVLWLCYSVLWLCCSVLWLCYSVLWLCYSVLWLCYSGSDPCSVVIIHVLWLCCGGSNLKLWLFCGDSNPCILVIKTMVIVISRW